MVELELVRTYPAPRQLVWDAWTDPDQIAQWWGPRLHVVADFTETVRAGAETGWASQLDKLAELLARRSNGL